MKIREEILMALSIKPRTITDLAKGSGTYKTRQPIRREVDALMAEGLIRRISIGQALMFVAIDWRMTDAYLMEYFNQRMYREGAHWIWNGGWHRNQRCVVRLDGKPYDVRREIYRIRTSQHLKKSQSVRPKCQHEQCMALSCLVVHEDKGFTGSKHSLKSKVKLANLKRGQSKYGAALVAQVKASEKTASQIARETGMALSTVAAIRAGRIWRDYSNPFADLFGRAA